MRTKTSKSSLTPLILIFLGGIFLLNNFGVLPWSIWLSLWKFWPVILILIGIEFLFGRSISMRTTIILFALVFVAPIFLFLNPFGGNPLTTSKLEINEALATATRSKIVVNLPAVNLKIQSLATDSARLVSGSMSYSTTGGVPTIIKTEDKGVAYLSLNQSTENNLPFFGSIRNDLELSLSRLIPIDLTLKSGAHNTNLDLTGLRVDSIEIETGTGILTIKYPKQFSNKTFIKTAASTVTFEIPAEVGSQIKITGGPKNVNIPTERFNKNGETYQSKNFDSAKIKIEIEVQIGAGSIQVK